MPVLSGTGFPQTGANRSRAQVRAELADLSGGANKPDIKAKVDRAWDAAVREFNSVAWRFLRTQEDIIIGSHMLDPVAPTVTNTGAGTGFLLSAGAKLDYWIEERVKDGARIIRRTTAINPLVVRTITNGGAPTTWKPVIVPGAFSNPDTTHWAIYRSGTYGPIPKIGTADAAGQFPYVGAELVELPVATLSYEDLSIGADPMQPSGAEGKIYRSGEFDLNFPFRNFVKAVWIDEQGRERRPLIFVPFRQWVGTVSRQTTVASPDFITLRNVHQNGKAILHPRPSGDRMTWPAIRLTYCTYIALAGSDDDSVLNVPAEVDQAIFMRAEEIFLGRLKGKQAAAPAPGTETPMDMRLRIEQDHRDWEDS